MTTAEPETENPFAVPPWPGMPELTPELIRERQTESATDWEAWGREAVPCEVVVDAKTKQPCGKPSEVRVKTRCAGCGKHYKFYCRRHYEELKAETIICVVCKSTLQESCW